MRYAPVILAATISVASASDRAAPGQNAIEEMLIRPTGWSAYVEVTTDDIPSPRANRLSWQFFRRDSAIVGRTTNMAAGFNCEFEVVVRENGIDVGRGARACSERLNTSLLRFEYDPMDPRFPFKHLSTPQRWWMSPNAE